MLSTTETYGRFREDVEEHAKNMLSDASYTAKAAGVTAVYGSVENGQPADMILALAVE